MTRRSEPWWLPARHAKRRARLLDRARLVAAMRGWFAQEGFIEVETPALQVSPGLEPHLKAFATEIEAPGGGRQRLYLHTSPEFAMKKLLAAGETRIVQFAPVFRNGERADTHHPAFTMLEWYRAQSTHLELMTDCRALLAIALKASGRSEFRWNGCSSDPARDWQVISVHEAMAQYAGIDLARCIEDPAAPPVAPMAEAARAIGVRVAEGDSFDDIFFRVFLDRVEPHLGTPAPTLLTDYPVHMAALARPKPGAPHLAERFELYVAGLELANAFGELTDTRVQRQRFEADMALKERLYGERYPIDEDFLAALALMPPAAGIALGLDRLAMLATHASCIEDVLWAPVVHIADEAKP